MSSAASTALSSLDLQGAISDPHQFVVCLWSCLLGDYPPFDKSHAGCSRNCTCEVSKTCFFLSNLGYKLELSCFGFVFSLISCVAPVGVVFVTFFPCTREHACGARENCLDVVNWSLFVEQDLICLRVYHHHWTCRVQSRTPINLLFVCLFVCLVTTPLSINLTQDAA